MPRKSVAQVIAEKEAKAAKHVSKTGKSMAHLRKKREIVSSENTTDAEKKSPSPHKLKIKPFPTR